MSLDAILGDKTLKVDGKDFLSTQKIELEHTEPPTIATY